MRKVIALVILCQIYVTGYCQHKSAQLTDSYAHNFTFHTNGSISVSGYLDSLGAGGREFFVSHYDSNGTFEWSKTIGGAANEYFSNITAHDQDILVYGSTNSVGIGSNDFCIIKMDSYGDTVFVKTFGTLFYDKITTLAVSDHSYYYGGQLTNGYANIVIGKLGKNGGLTSNMYLPGNHDQSIDKIVLAGNELVAVGKSDDDILVVKLDTNLNRKWSKIYGAPNIEQATSLAMDDNFNIYVTGYTTSSTFGLADGFLMKLDSSGNKVWLKYYGHFLSQKFNDVIYDNGRLYVTGYSQSYLGTYDDQFYMIADSNGNTISDAVIANANEDYGTKLMLKDKILSIGGPSKILFSPIWNIESFQVNVDSVQSCQNDTTSLWSITDSLNLFTDSMYLYQDTSVLLMEASSGFFIQHHNNPLLGLNSCKYGGFPNSVKKEIQLDFTLRTANQSIVVESDDMQNHHFQLYDISGRLLSSQLFRKHLEISLSSYPPGLFIVNIDARFQRKILNF